MIANSNIGHRILPWIDAAAIAIEILAVVIILVAIFVSVGRYLFQAILHPEVEERYRQLRLRLGRTLLLGLEILVAADIVRTVTLEATPGEHHRIGLAGCHPHIPELGAGS
jgi:uncharacterized membrane protein